VAAVIENPIINSPFTEPTHHWALDSKGQLLARGIGAHTLTIGHEPGASTLSWAVQKR
jgi:hypothetical protein